MWRPNPPRNFRQYSPPSATANVTPLSREQIASEFKWDLSPIFENLDAWSEALEHFKQSLQQYQEIQGRLHEGSNRLLETFQLDDRLGQLAYRLWYYPSLLFDTDQRDNEVGARRQQAQGVFALWQESTAWIDPEILILGEKKVLSWLGENEAFAPYRFRMDNLFRCQQHVLDHQGESLLSLATLFSDSPEDAYSALSTADMVFPTINLSHGEETRLSYGRYRTILNTSRVQEDRSLAFHTFHNLFKARINTFASLYSSICHRDWFHARARRYDSTLEAALNGNNIPPSVVHSLIQTAREGSEPLRRYHRLRKERLKLADYHLYDGSIPLVEGNLNYPWKKAVPLVIDSVAPLGAAYQEKMRKAMNGGYIDVYEAEGKRSGAYSAGIWGVHPYVLLNYNETLDDLFTLAHEMGHSLHTVLAQETQPFATSNYTIFVAEVASTLGEALLLDHLLGQTDDPRERIHLLGHAIDSIGGTFFTQTLFADFEWQAHRRVERGEPITAEILGNLYKETLESFYGDAIEIDDDYRLTWARIPHFFQSPYYVYQYATSFAASAHLYGEMKESTVEDAPKMVEQYLRLLQSGGNDYPVEQLKKAGVDLTQANSFRAVIDQFTFLVDELEATLATLKD